MIAQGPLRGNLQWRLQSTSPTHSGWHPGGRRHLGVGNLIRADWPAGEGLRSGAWTGALVILD